MKKIKYPILFFILTFTILFSACDNYYPTESKTFSPTFGIEALLVHTRPLDSIWLTLSYDIFEAQNPKLPFYDSAIIVIYNDNISDTLVPNISDTLPNCFVSTNRDYKVKCGETYNLYAKIYKAGVDTAIITSSTTVPDSFTCLPLAPVWLKNNNSEFRDSILKEDYKFLASSLIDTTKTLVDSDGNLSLNYLPVNEGDTLYYVYDNGLIFSTFLILQFYDITFNMADSKIVSYFDVVLQYFNFLPPLPPNNSCKGVMIEYEWGTDGTDWDDLEFVMSRNPFGMLDSGSYLEGYSNIELNILPNDKLYITMAISPYVMSKYLGSCRYNLYGVDAAAYDFQITRLSENPVSNINGGFGVFGSAALYRINYFAVADSLIITNKESKEIKDSKEKLRD